MLPYFRSTTAKVLRRVALLHRALHNEDKTSSCSKAVEVKDCTTLEKVEWICTVSLRLVE